MIRRLGLGLTALLAACTTSSSAPPRGGDASTDAAPDARPPPWLHDAGLAVRPPVARPLRELCGIASNPGDMPTGTDAVPRAKRAGYFRAANDLGVSMIRRDFLWYEIEPSQGSFVWDAYDALVAEATAAGVRLLGTPYNTPAWAGDPTAGNSGVPAPKNTTDYAAFAGAVAARYAGKVAGWEVWNEESNGFRFWAPTMGGDPMLYGALLAAAHDAMRAADPATPVLFGGCTFDPQLIPGAIDFQSSVFAGTPGVAAKVEAVALHPYELYPPDTAPEFGSSQETPLDDKVQEEAWLLSENGAGATPIWLTELGWPVAGDVDEAAQARYLVRATILAARAGAAAVFWYTLRDGPHPDQFPPEDAFGLLHNDGQFGAADAGDAGGIEATPKRSYLALRALLKAMGARWPSASAPAVTGLPGDGYAVSFAGTDPGTVIALWTLGSSATVTGLHGNTVDIVGTPLGASDGGVAVGPDPVYVTTP